MKNREFVVISELEPLENPLSPSENRNKSRTNEDIKGGPGGNRGSRTRGITYSKQFCRERAAQVMLQRKVEIPGGMKTENVEQRYTVTVKDKKWKHKCGTTAKHEVYRVQKTLKSWICYKGGASNDVMCGPLS